MIRTVLLTAALLTSTLAHGQNISVTVDGRVYQCSGSSGELVARLYKSPDCNANRWFRITEDLDCNTLPTNANTDRESYSYKVEGVCTNFQGYRDDQRNACLAVVF